MGRITRGLSLIVGAAAVFACTQRGAVAPASAEHGTGAAEEAGGDEGSADTPSPAPVAPALRGADALAEVDEILARWSPTRDEVVARARALAQEGSDSDAGAFDGACAAGDGSACLRVGARALDGTAGGMQRLIDAWSRGCALGEATACDWLAATLLADQRYALVHSLLGPACPGGESDVSAACAAVAWSTIEQGGDAGAQASLAQACERGHAVACRLAASAVAGPVGAVSRSALLDAGCAAGDALACVGVALAQREAGTLDPRPLAAACDEGVAAACRAAGVVWEELGGTDASEGSGATLLERGCVAQDAWSCGLLAEWRLRNAPDPATGLLDGTVWFVTGCNLGHGPTCWRFATLLASLEGGADANLIGDLRRRACEGGVAEACAEAGAAAAHP
jgi:hypothetical protein